MEMWGKAFSSFGPVEGRDPYSVSGGQFGPMVLLVFGSFFRSSFDPAVLLLGICPEEITRDASEDVLFIIVKQSKQM